MSKLWNFIKKHFLTKKFLTFGVIGVINTGIHLSVYYLFYNVFFNIENDLGLAFWSNTLAFISASTFSYFANAIFTFKPKRKSTVQFSIVMLVFLLRWIISSSLTSLFDSISINWLNFDYEASSMLSLVAPLLASGLLIPIAYFALDWVFRKTDEKKAEDTL
ncbi:MAG: GtrA family protein [Tenericutes bacterium]|nr:GtrA family protein [Mycoplasmatota bacterium]